MKIFNTERLEVRVLQEKDRDVFVELLTDPRVIDPAPHQKTDLAEVLKKFELSLKTSSTPMKNRDNIWASLKK